MKYTWFINCSTVAEVKALFRDLALENHPDKGGKKEIFIEIFNEYKSKLASLDGQTDKDSEGNEYFYKFDEEKEVEIAGILGEILGKLPSYSTAYLVGMWIWVLGTKKEDGSKELLNKYKFRWHKKRNAWYLPGCKSNSYRSKASKGIDEIASKYGASKIINKKKLFLTDQSL